MTGIIVGVALAVLILLVGAAILVGGVTLSFKAEHSDCDFGFGIFMGSVIAGGIITLIGAIAVGDAAAKLVKYNLLSDVIIEVLDKHGIAEVCKHIECRDILEHGLPENRDE